MELLIFVALLSIVLFAPTPVEERRRELQEELVMGSRTSWPGCRQQTRPAQAGGPERGG